MKVGDLVKWTNPAAESYGVVVGLRPEAFKGDIFSGMLMIRWIDGQGHGLYESSHKYLEVVSEGR